MKYLYPIFAVIAFCSFVQADSSDHFHPDSAHESVQTDSLDAARNEIRDSGEPKMKLIKRTFDHKRQVYLAAGMMAFIAIIMTTAQSWNPE